MKTEKTSAQEPFPFNEKGSVQMKLSSEFLLVVGFGILSSLAAHADDFCLGSGVTMPDFGMSYSYTAICSSPSKTYSKTVPIIVGIVGEARKEQVKSETVQKLAADNLVPIAQMGEGDGQFTLFSDQSPDPKAAYCVLYGVGGPLCTSGVALNTDIEKNTSPAQILENNGFQQIATIKDVQDSDGNVETASVYTKK